MNIAHEDSRRRLYSFPEAKLIEAKTDCIIGKHYHKIKEEVFILCKGEGILYLYPETKDRHRMPFVMKIGMQYVIPPEQYHEFHLTKGSVLVGLNSRPYDPSDDYHTDDNTSEISVGTTQTIPFVPKIAPESILWLDGAPDHVPER